MSRRKSYTKNALDTIFAKAKITNKSNRRIDINGREIDRASYGQEKSKFGWNVDHIDENRNNNEISNLQPLHYQSHLEKNRR